MTGSERDNARGPARKSTKPYDKGPNYADQFAPDRAKNRTVKCTHCGQSFGEHEARYEVRPAKSPHLPPDTALWWCRNSRCEGAGIGFDLLTGDPETDVRPYNEYIEANPLVRVVLGFQRREIIR